MIIKLCLKAGREVGTTHSGNALVLTPPAVHHHKKGVCLRYPQKPFSKQNKET